MVFTAAQQIEHLLGVIAVGRLSQYLSAALGNRVAADDRPTIDAGRDVGCLLSGEARDEFRRCLAAAHAALGRFVRRDDLERVTRFGQELSSARRAAGQNQSRGWHR
jgi:hypothetical protein